MSGRCVAENDRPPFGVPLLIRRLAYQTRGRTDISALGQRLFSLDNLYRECRKHKRNTLNPGRTGGTDRRIRGDRAASKPQ